MKKALMGTTALVAAAVTTGVAVAEEMAAEPISLTIGGRSHWGVAVFDNEAKANDDDLRISNDALLTFTGSTVLDSGLEVGMRIEIEGEKAADQGDAKYASVSGSFGEIRIGNEDTAGKKMATTAPYATYFYGINDAYWSFSASSAYDADLNSETWMTTYADAGAGASASLLYFSPVINGFQFGLSYAPEASAEAQSATASTKEGGEVYSMGLRYDGAFGDVGVTIAGGYASMDVPKGADQAEVKSVTAMRDVMLMTFKNETESALENVYRKLDGTGGEVAANNSVGVPVNVFQNPDWLSKKHLAALDAADLEVKDDATSYTVDLTPDDDNSETTVVHKYHEASTTPGANNIYYKTEGKDASEGRTATEWAGGIVVSMSGVSVGGSMSILDDDMGDDDLTQYDLGIKYGEGAWSVSANMGNASDEDQDLDTDFVRLLANYNLGPGINLAGAVGSDSPDTGNDTTFAGIALGISF